MKQISDLNVKAKTIKLLKENIWDSLYKLNSQRFLRKGTKSSKHKKINKLGFKLKNSSKDIKKMKG